jgi:outer membrane protein assembly factor BamB
MLSIVAASSAMAQSPFPRDIIPGRSPLERVGLERQWFTVIPLVETERLIRISRTQDMFFAQTNYARVHALDPESGRILWTAHVGERSGRALGVADNSWAVCVTTANLLFGLDRGTGRELWRVNLNTLPSSTPACDESRVLVGMNNGMIVGHRLKYVDQKGVEHIYDKPVPLWSYHAGTAIRTRPILAESLAAFGGGDNKLWVVLADEPTVLFRLSTGGPIGEGLGAYGTRTLLVPSEDKVLYAVDLFTAQLQWTFPSGSPIAQAPLVAGDDIYVINTAGDLSSLDPRTGQARWTVPTQGGQLISVTPSRVFLRSYNHDLFVVDRATGRMIVDPSGSHIRAGLNLREYDLSIVNRFNDRSYFGTRSGMILALREVGQTRPHLLRDPKQPPFGYVPPEGIQTTPPIPPPVEAGATPEGEPAPEGDTKKEGDKPE